jgi:hypothetical protein
VCQRGQGQRPQHHLRLSRTLTMSSSLLAPMRGSLNGEPCWCRCSTFALTGDPDRGILSSSSSGAAATETEMTLLAMDASPFRCSPMRPPLAVVAPTMEDAVVEPLEEDGSRMVPMSQSESASSLVPVSVPSVSLSLSPAWVNFHLR